MNDSEIEEDNNPDAIINNNDYDVREANNSESEINEDEVSEEEVSEEAAEAVAGPISSVDADLVNIEGAVSSSVQIAPTEDDKQDEDEDYSFIELGDRVVIDSKKYGRVSGNVYYRDENLISVLPDGLSNTLIDFAVEQKETEEVFDEELGVIATFIIDKRKFDSFIEQQDLRVNQTIETIDAEGNIDKVLKIISVNLENDSINVEDESGASETIEFAFIGIPRDQSFIILRSRQEPEGLKEDEGEELVEGKEEKEEQGKEEQDEETEEQQQPQKKKIKIVGYVTLAKATVYKEAPAVEQRYPDNIQKIDALNDFLNMLDPVLQKDQKAIRAVRILVETLNHLKHSTIEYNSDGTFKGYKVASANTIAELIEKVSVPLGRPILNIAKKLYTNDDKKADAINEESDDLVNTDDVYFQDFKEELLQMEQGTSQIVSNKIISGERNESINVHWLNTQNFLKEYLSPWMPNSTASPEYVATRDAEFFRKEAPELDENNYSLEGYVKTPEKLKQILGKVAYSYNRALSTTYKKGADKKKQVLLQPESATINSYLLFPLSSAAQLGTTRSGSVAIDSGRSQVSSKKTMKDILIELGEAKEVATPLDLLLLDTNGDTLGNIPINDYISGINIPGLGIGDTFFALNQFGLDSLELTPGLFNILQNKILAYQNQLISSLSKLRSELKAISEKKDEEREKEGDNQASINFLPNTTLLEEGVRSEPILVDDIQNFEKINPSLSKSDIAQIAYLLRKHADYFQVAACENSVYTAKERLRATRDMFLESLTIMKILKYNKQNSGQKPIPNNCEHVSKLVTIRKIQDDMERFQLLTKFTAYYQGDRDNNWINCNVCEKHLICIHERLQIQSFTNPREKEVIQKEIILNFAGGQFQGKYICRNCGQPIKDIEFDTHLEYDDDGRPMMGRSVLVDKDQIEQENLDVALGAPVNIKDELKLSDNESEIYYIVKEIANKVGINIVKEGYRSIINKVQDWLNKLPDMITYGKIKDKSKVKLPSYQEMKSKNLVCACGCFLLLEIQTKIPSYVVLYTLQGCNDPGFNGYPLDDANKQGLEYISCAISSINKSTSPWNETKYQDEPSDIKRQSAILYFMETILKRVVNDDLIQQQLADKKKYLTNILGADPTKGVPKDSIPSSFLPEQIILNNKVMAEDAIIPEVAQYMGKSGMSSISKAWIRQSHSLANKTAAIIKSSPFAETSCCLVNIKTPNGFWNNISDLPELSKRSLTTNIQGPAMQTHFNPRKIEELLVEPEESLYYRLFLKYCYQGVRKGQLHEPGLTNKCYWCGFQFPVNSAIIDSDSEGKGALESQNVKTSSEEFTDLLDTIHTVNYVEPVKEKVLSSTEDVLSQFAKLYPPPTAEWENVILDTVDKFKSLTKDANRSDLVIALGPLSNSSNQSERLIRQVFNENQLKLLEDICNQSWLNWFQIISHYFIVPINRILVQYNTTTLKLPQELASNISDKHDKDIQEMLNNDTRIVRTMQEYINKPSSSLARVKLGHFVKQLSAIIGYKNKIRATLIPGKAATLKYMQRCMLYGPLATLLNPDIIPETENINTEEFIQSYRKTILDDSVKVVNTLISTTLEKYKVENLSFSDDKIKELITIRNEKEKINIIKEFDVMTDEQRTVELIKKRLGIGKWAVGGTKLIYAYDPEQYDREREEREKAGIISFPGMGPDDTQKLDGRTIDATGLYIYGSDEDYERDGGYDHVQTNEDDA